MCNVIDFRWCTFGEKLFGGVDCIIVGVVCGLCGNCISFGWGDVSVYLILLVIMIWRLGIVWRIYLFCSEVG